MTSVGQPRRARPYGGASALKRELDDVKRQLDSLVCLRLLVSFEFDDDMEIAYQGLCRREQELLRRARLSLVQTVPQKGVKGPSA